MAHIYTVATTILVDIESNQPLTDSELRDSMFEVDYRVRGKGELGQKRYEISDREMKDWELVAEREEA